MSCIRRRRSELAWKKSGSVPLQEDEIVEYPPGPIDIKPSWHPINKTDKPPYSYATIIGHAILTSKDRRLTLHDIYVWITEHYPFYNNDTQGWQNSIRHNLSLHKSFVKIDRDQCGQNPPRKGCFWTIRSGREKFFVDNLQKPANLVRKQHSLSQFVASSRKNSTATTSSSSSSSNSSIASSSRTEAHHDTGLLGATTAEISTNSATYLETSPVSYDLLSNVPETSTSYNVYPEHNVELFGDQHDFYSNYSPSLCDTFSTTSSSLMYKSPYDVDNMLDWAPKDSFSYHFLSHPDHTFHI